MSELMIEQGLGPVDRCRNEMIEIFNNPDDMEDLENYFKHNVVNVNDEQFYGCNGWDCNCNMGRTFAMLKYIAYPEESRRLLRNSSESEILSYQNSYYYSSLLPVDEIKFEWKASENRPAISINGKLSRESKIMRIKDLGLEDYISIT